MTTFFVVLGVMSFIKFLYSAASLHYAVSGKDTEESYERIADFYSLLSDWVLIRGEIAKRVGLTKVATMCIILSDGYDHSRQLVLRNKAYVRLSNLGLYCDEPEKSE